MALPEYRGWSRFVCENPPGDVRTQALLGQLCALISNALRKKGDKPLRATDFMPWIDRGERGPAVERQAEINREQARELRDKLRLEREAAVE